MPAVRANAEAQLFVAEGAKVVIADVLETEGKKLATELGEAAMFQHLDVPEPGDWTVAVQATQERFGKLDVWLITPALSNWFPLRSFRWRSIGR